MQGASSAPPLVRRGISDSVPFTGSPQRTAESAAGCYAPTLARLSHAMYANELRDEQVAAEVLAQVGAFSRRKRGKDPAT